MASFYSTLSSEGDMLPTSYLLNQKLASYQSSEFANNKDYANQPCVSLSYPDLLSGESTGSRDENVFIPPTTSIQQMNRHLNIAPRYSDGNTVISDARAFSKESSFTQYHGLSLSLGSQEQTGLAHMSSDMNQYTNSGLFSLLSSNMQSGLQNNEIKNVQYLSFDLAGKAENSVKAGTSNSFQNMIMPSPHHHQVQETTGAFGNSKYLKAAQELLDELVNVRGASNQPGKGHKSSSVGPDVKNGVSAELHESANDAPRDLSPSERHDLQNKVSKLFAMLDEVDRRYKQYCHQMQAVVSQFDMVAGRGAAQPYTMLALRTISRQFRCLRDAIKKQIEATQKSLGEQQDLNSHGQGVLSRLRYVDQQLRQQKALQQFGIMRQPWRPQRGLPESAVSVLRAWLFEHFLHPYPKDSEKMVLAKQTGLTRSQVANWFINARVRLWKPMIEEMYKEEFGDAETEPNSSSEHLTTNQDFSSLDDREEQFQGSLLSNATRPDAISSLDVCRAELSYENVAFQGNESNFGLQNKQFLNVTGNSIFSDNTASPEKSNTIGNQVSLALGLQHSEKDSQLTDGGIESKGNDATSSTSMALDKLEYYYVDPVNNQHRFGNGHLLSDFVA